MKDLRIILIITLIVVSCNKKDIDMPVVHGPEITFSELSTRAAITNENFATEFTEFGVWAEMDKGDGSNLIDLLDNERVYKVDSDWTYDNKRYWVYDYYFHFFATYPYKEVSTVTPTKLTQDEVEYPGYKVSFTTPAAADEDFMIAHKTERTVAGNSFPESVELGFEHTLTSVSIKITQDFGKNENDDFRVTSASLTGLKKSGDFYTSRSAEYDENWVLNNETISFNYSGGDSPENIRNLENDELLPFGEMLLLPQVINAKSVGLTINYQFKVQDGTEWEDKRGEIFLPATTWSKSSRVTYIVSLHEDNSISIPAIEVSISSWGGNNPGGTIIIK